MTASSDSAFDVGAMQAQASKASTLLSAMCNEKRLMILCQLVQGETSVNDLARALGARQSTVSQHLALLRRDGFVTARRTGQAHLYSLAGDDARSILATLQSLYCDPPAKDA
ncbi:MAG: metalloregulator ArsR/SmtB family transcription factor [Gammaproteobacteria bacterium]|nr:metalloregulator ArsR/SmtB family transcription factor [Gammaproteobacteria bacterium]